MVCKGCLPQILLGPLLNTLSHIVRTFLEETILLIHELHRFILLMLNLELQSINIMTTTFSSPVHSKVLEESNSIHLMAVVPFAIPSFIHFPVDIL